VALRLPKAFIDEMIAHALEDHPNEACGIIAGKDGSATQVFRAINAAASPYRYEVDDKDLFRIYKECTNNDWEFLAIYHSHTASEAYPSPTDVRLAAWPEAYYVLVSTKNQKSPVIRAYRILGEKISEEPLETV
jgi:proteasome lid subunit RPN8/RPN11